MVYTWQYLKYLADAAHFTTEVVADLESTLRDKHIEIKPGTELDEPPALPRGPGDPQPCVPPWNCRMPTAELHDYVEKLRGYVDRILARTDELVVAAREKGVTEFSYRVVDRPDPPKTTETKRM